MYQSPELDAIRQRIDTLDNQVHDLLMERADLVMAISEEKKRRGIQIVQPAREARMIRRLIARHRAPLPEETIVRLWRELVGSISLLQTGLSVSVCGGLSEYWDMARDYFGTVLPMKKTADPSDAVEEVRSGRTTFAVLPWPVDAENVWWSKLRDYPDLKIIQRLPFGDKENYSYQDYPALVIAKAGFDTSDDDHSLIVVDAGNEVSALPVFDAVTVCRSGEYSLLKTKSFVSERDERLEKFDATLIGGYPSPLVYGQPK